MRTFKALGAALCLCVCLAGQSNYPGALDTNTDLAVAVNNFSAKLTGQVTSTDTAWVLSGMTATPVVDMLLSVDCFPQTTACEIVRVTSVSSNLVTVVRGVDGTAPNGHKANAKIEGFMTALHHNGLRDAVQKIEGALGPNLANVAAQISAALGPTLTNIGLGLPISPLAYDFTPQTPGGSLIAGNNTVTLTPVPAGVNGSNTGHYLYVSNGTGTNESCLITGGSAVSGAASGALIIQCANTHSGAWTIRSATAGIEEALWTAPTQGDVHLPPGQYRIYAPILIGAGVSSSSIGTAPTLSGAGRQSTFLVVDPSFPLSATGVVNLSFSASTGSGQFVRDLSIVYTQPDSTDISTYTHWPPAIKSIGASKPTLRNLAIILAWDGIDFTGSGSNGATIENVIMSAYHRGISFDQVFDSVYLTHFHFWPVGATVNQLNAMVSDSIVAVYSGRMDDLHWSDSLVYGAKCGDFHDGTGGPTLAEIHQLACDNSTGLTIASGQTTISNSKFALGSLSGAVGVKITGGNVTISNSDFGQPIGTVTPGIIYMVPGSAGAVVQVTGNYFNTYNTDTTSIQATSTTTGDSSLVAVGNFFQRTSDNPYAFATIDVNATSGHIRATIVGNSTPLKGTGTGYFAKLHQDDGHMVRANRLGGWIFSVPAADIGIYEGDNVRYSPLGMLQQLGRAAFAALGTPPAAGFQVYCTDCTTAATCAGSGTGHAATSNGTAWTCN